MMNIRRVVLGVAVLVAAGGLVAPARAQRPLNVTGNRNLTFGALLPGVPETVLRTDAANAGRFNMRGARRLEVRVVFTLPSLMTAPGGFTMPIQFGAGDGGFNTQNNIGTSRVFDPRVPLVTRLSNNGRLFLWLGGTVLPAATQRAATYTAVITVTAAYTGN